MKNPSRISALMFGVLVILIMLAAPNNLASEEASPCDKGLAYCMAGTCGLLIWQVACIVGWAWCVTYIEATGFAN
jgi:hypothetical protein